MASWTEEGGGGREGGEGGEGEDTLYKVSTDPKKTGSEK